MASFKHTFLKKTFKLFLTGTLFIISTFPFQAQTVSETIKNPDSLKQIKSQIFNYTQIKTNPLTVFWGAIPLTSEYRLTYETANAPDQYFNIGAAWLGENLLLFKGMSSYYNSSRNLNFKGYHVHFNYRWTIGSDEYIPTGFYIGPYFSYAHLRLEHQLSSGLNDHAFIEHMHAAALLGYQVNIYDIFYFDFFGGAGYKDNSWGNKINSSQKLINLNSLDFVYESHIKLKLGFSMGVRID